MTFAVCQVKKKSPTKILIVSTWDLWNNSGKVDIFVLLNFRVPNKTAYILCLSTEFFKF